MTSYGTIVERLCGQTEQEEGLTDRSDVEKPPGCDTPAESPRRRMQPSSPSAAYSIGPRRGRYSSGVRYPSLWGRTTPSGSNLSTNVGGTGIAYRIVLIWSSRSGRSPRRSGCRLGESRYCTAARAARSGGLERAIPTLGHARLIQPQQGDRLPVDIPRLAGVLTKPDARHRQLSITRSRCSRRTIGVNRPEADSPAGWVSCSKGIWASDCAPNRRRGDGWVRGLVRVSSATTARVESPPQVMI